jgi:hypothetical protein
MRRVANNAAILAAAASSTVLVILRAVGWPNGYVLADPGLDFKWVVWAPVRGVLDGYNVYDAHSGYARAFDVGGAATAHTPSSLAVLAPFAAPPLASAWLLFVIATTACIWLSLWLLANPTTRRDHVVLVVFGTLLVAGGFGEYLTVLGDPTGIALLGLALMVRFPTSRWGALGVLLLSFVPQTAIPLSVFLARGRGRILMIGWSMSLLLSVPPLVVAWRAEGLSRVGSSLFDTVPSVVGNANRVDVVGRLVGHELTVTVIALALAGIVVWRTGWTISPVDLPRLLLATSLVTAVWYHEPYDLVLLGAVVGATLIRANRRDDVFMGLVFVLACVLTSGIVFGPLAHAWGADAPPVWRLVSGLLVITLLFASAISCWEPRGLRTRRASSGP